MTVVKESFAAKRLREATDYMKSDLEGHVITRVRFGVWRCAQPGTLINSFHVTYSPGALIVHGDIGDLMFVPHKPNVMRWALGVFRPDYIDYPLEKLSSQIEAKEFVRDVADENIDYLIESEEDPERKKRMIEARPHSEIENEHDYYDYMYDWADDMDGLQPYTWTLRTLIVYQALCWFFAHVSFDDERFKEELAS